MSEEEKKAIDYLKNDVVYWLDKGKDFVIIDNGEIPKMKSILNLIENQQKEIEDLKEQNNQLSNYLYDSYYVSADKIRKRIEEYDKWIKEGGDYTESLEAQKYALQELLEEN